MKNAIRLALAAVLLLGSAMPLAFGAGTTSPTANYSVEVLVFAIQAPEFEGGELWTRAEQPIDTSDAVLPRQMPPSADFSNIVSTLQTDDRYRILLERHWIQPGDTRSNVPPVLLTTGDRELNGTLRFYLSRFMHVELNLMYEPPASVIGADIVPPDYVIDEQRRIRKNELSYFDHPKFGVIVKVSPAAS